MTIVLCLVVALAGLVRAPAARAEFNWPTELRVPDNDWALGVSGGVAFGEAYRAGTTGWLLGVDASWLEGLFGIHGGLRIHREGFSYRLSGYLEGTIWYLVMFGVGAQVGAMVDDGGTDVPNIAVALHGYFGVPIPLYSDESGGSLVLIPYARPGMRLLGQGEVTGYHEAGLSLRWTSFSF